MNVIEAERDSETLILPESSARRESSCELYSLFVNKVRNSGDA